MLSIGLIHVDVETIGQGTGMFRINTYLLCRIDFISDQLPGVLKVYHITKSCRTFINVGLMLILAKMRQLYIHKAIDAIKIQS